MNASQKVTAASVRSALHALAKPAKSKFLQRFFKTGPGEYSEGDVFIGVTVPAQRALAAKFKELPFSEILKLLHSKIHEERLTALILLVGRFQRFEGERAAIYKAYMRNLRWVNNWDLVDSSAHQIVGAWLRDRSRAPLYRLAKSKVLWERRVAMVATYHLIRAGEHREVFAIAERLLKDQHDLMHKAVGWMLRELGKHVSEEKLRGFLKKNAARMPRTALRYSIERFTPAERKRWLAY